MSTPSLLNIPYLYKAGTLYSQIPESGAGDFTVTRATTPTAGRSTRINKDGLIELVADNVPRLDYPLGGAVNGCPALLVEPSAQNLFQRSEDFSNIYWSKISCVASGNLTIAPDGNLTADKLIMGNGISPSLANQSGLTRSETVTSSAYRFSVFAKSAEFTGFRVRENALNGTFLDVNLTNGAITNPDVTQFVNPLAENYGNGWYRISWTSPTITSLAKYTIRVGSTGDGVSGIFIWGAQVETGSVATSYIPTTTQAITRAAEVINKTGIASLIGQSEGTIYWEGDALSVGGQDIFFVNRNATNSVVLYKDGANRLITRVHASGGAALTIIDSVTRTGFVKVAIAYKSGDTTFYINGTKIGVTNTTAFTFTVTLDTFRFGENPWLVGRGDQRCRAVAVYPNRISDSDLATLTTP